MESWTPQHRTFDVEAFFKNSESMIIVQRNFRVRVTAHGRVPSHNTVKKQNFRYWAQDNPRQLHERPLHSEKVTVWAAVSKSRVIGPYFLKKMEEQSP